MTPEEKAYAKEYARQYYLKTKDTPEYKERDRMYARKKYLIKKAKKEAQKIEGENTNATM